MAYSKYYPEGWKENEDGGTPINAASLNNMEQGIINAHNFMARSDNPHNVTKMQIGLGNVPDVSTNNQTPTYTAVSALAALVSGEKLSVAFGKLAKSVSDLITHIADNVRHITEAERTAWSAKAETTTATTSADGLMSASDKQELARLRELINGIDASIYLSAGPGNPVSVSDAYADSPLRAFTVDFQPVQAGSGVPSPDNVRPISGYTALTVKRYGQSEEDNLLSVPFSFDSVDVTGQNEPGVVYGGTLDVLTGTLTVSWKTRDLTSLSWGTAVHNNPQGIANGYQHSANLGGFHPVSDQNMMLWSHYKNSTTGFTGVPDLSARKPNQNYFIIRDDRFDNNDDWLAYVRAQSDAGTPLQLSVPLATPLTFQLSPAQIAALPGVNTFSATAGDVSVTYRVYPTITGGS